MTFNRHLNGTVLESFARPAVLITDAYNALNNQPARRQRDQEFIGKVFFLSKLQQAPAAHLLFLKLKEVPMIVV